MKHLKVVRLFLFALSFMFTGWMCNPSQALAAGESAQSITLSGTLFDQNNFASPLLDTNVVFRVQILDPTKTCVLYEETLPPISTLGTNGSYSVKVGTIVGHPNRTGDDPGHPMIDILQNVAAISATNPTCAGGVYNPSSGDLRHLRVFVDPSTGPIEQMSPDMALNSVTNALVCESVQGLDRSKLLEFGTHVNAAMTAANALRLFDGSDVGALHNHDGEYAKLSGSGSITMGSQSTIGIGEFTTAQQTTLVGSLGAGDAGKMWYNSTSQKMIYWDGSSAQEVGTGSSGGAVTSVFGRTGTVTATAGDYSASQVTNTPAGSIISTSVQTAINELDTEKLSLSGGSLTGSLGLGFNKITGLADPTVNQDAATKAYVDSAISTSGGSFVATAGDSMTGALAMGSNKITGLANPTANQDAATKVYSDSNLRGSSLPAPGPTQDGQGIKWDNGASAWVYFDPATGSVSSSTSLTAGAGLTGGGDLSTDRIFNIGAGTGITVAADSVSVDVGTTANKIVQLDGSARLPAVDGSLLTNLPGGDITGVTAGTGLTGGGTSGAVTLNVDAGTTANKIVQLDGSARLPAVDGSLLTNVSGTDSTKVAKSGDTMTGTLTLPSNGLVAGTNQLVISGGNIGIGTAAPSQKLDVNGSIQAVSFFYTSDRRLKTNFEDIEGLETILKLHGVRFDWIRDGKAEIGLIAQEVEAVLPELVHTNPITGFKSVKYGNLVAPLIESTKELHDLIKNNQRSIASLENQVNQLMKQDIEKSQRIKDLESRLKRIEELLLKK